MLEWVAISFSRGSSQPIDLTCISCVPYVDRRILLSFERPRGMLKTADTCAFSVVLNGAEGTNDFLKIQGDFRCFYNASVLS